eukprot:TRINITY_DN6394_c0_g1_i2.p1 TRINITY_DN6394_c0_g1~~TRINITY_DN6394_c0_g1_i2.p1  ORF type:complete len:736 (-),score=240.02 TRINITY_DN6394_c0_g1_i2:105-2312(-)
MKKEPVSLLSRMFLKLGKWTFNLANYDEKTIHHILNYFQLAIDYDKNGSKTWHAWAMAHYEAISHYEALNQTKRVQVHLVPALKGLSKSIALSSQTFQDTLRLITLWWKYGALQEVESALQDAFNIINIDAWLLVIPQLIARIHAPNQSVRKMIQDLLISIGRAHPQALVYPITVAAKSQSSTRVSAAMNVVEKLYKYNPALMEQAQLVSHELIRVSIIWHEMWYDGCVEASHLNFEEHNPEGMIATFKPLHEILEKGPETPTEQSFFTSYGKELQEAHEFTKRWERNRRSSDLNQAWDLYSHVFRRLKKQLPSSLDLQHDSPKLQAVRDLELAIPGSYRPGEAVVQIKSFHPHFEVLFTKQRPKKFRINASDGSEYQMILKGHEDLRQDERVMQFFGLVNTLLANNYETNKDHHSIQKYSIVPLSPNSGLIGWVPHSDTLHQLIKEYRDARKILVNIEHRLMLQMAPNLDHLTLMQKVEVFQNALEQTAGQDLERILWLKSGSAEVWLERRTNYTRSLAVMSMVGHVLGLGDRHPANMMLDRTTAKVIHIDFGDCFEVAMHREKYPEKVPFRLTRMLINAMEVSGIEGTYRLTCESVMHLLRQNKESLMAVLEAFVYDPIINWRLLTASPSDLYRDTRQSKDPFNLGEEVVVSSGRDRRSNSQLPSFSSADSMPEILNRRALQVIKRVSRKLTGRDFGDGSEVLNVGDQVNKLIQQATSHDNLCQCFVGWCPFW